MGIFTQLRDGDDGPDEHAGSPGVAGPEPAGREVVEPAQTASTEDAQEAAGASGGCEEGDAESKKRGTFGRRLFLGGTAAAVAGAGAAHYWPQSGTSLLRLGQTQNPRFQPLGDPISVTPPVDQTYDYFIQVERDEDLLLLDFYFYNFTTRQNAENQLFLTPTDAANYIVVRMPPQAICEAVYWQADGEQIPGNPYASDPTGLPADPSPILSAMSGQSQLCFTMDESDAIEITGSVTDLLDWSTWTLNVPPSAQQPQPSPPATYGPLGSFDTFVEFPYCLFLSPSIWVGSTTLDFNGLEIPIGFTTTFSNRTAPLGDVVNTVTGATVNEIFATTLSQQLNGAFFTGGTGLAAVFCTDFGLPGVGPYDMTPQQNIYYGGHVT